VHMKLQAFSFFHLNLAYSAIEVAQRKDVIERCYWPLLRLARARQLPFGIEVSAWTLETIAEIDPAWLAELRDLVTNGPCEFIGCGYAQVIGPLAPVAVNRANFRLGMQRYEALLGLRPKIALVNEQAYSAGLVPLYLEAGYEALIMEWNNPARAHPAWPSEWRYLPQYAHGTGDKAMPLIWNKSISFQKFQRYVHGEIELDEYMDYVRTHQGSSPRAFPVYGNDVEVFDFRPGRYMTEAPLRATVEWQRIDAMYAALQAEPGIDMIPTSGVLSLMGQPGAGNRLQLETAAQPVPVKKQDKYNLLRWAVTGRDDLGINTRCWQIAEAMEADGGASDADWTELCYLWSSDFRTHITESRWQDYRLRLEACHQRWVTVPSAMPVSSLALAEVPESDGSLTVQRVGRWLEVRGRRLSLRLNCLRGLALESLIDAAVSEKSLCGTVHHGYFDDIQWGADYYSGHLVFESPGRPKVTDLNAVEPVVAWVKGGVCVKATVATILGPVDKTWWIDEAGGEVTLSYRLHWKDVGVGSLRLGQMTLNPEAFDAPTLSYRTHNGGQDLEQFPMAGDDFDHGSAVSFLISANHAVGLTQGDIDIGDAHRCVRVRVSKSQAAVVGLVTHRIIRDKYLCRAALSARELDDTCRGGGTLGPLEIDLRITCAQRIKAA
jgi:hypothetical protein